MERPAWQHPFFPLGPVVHTRTQRTTISPSVLSPSNSCLNNIVRHSRLIRVLHHSLNSSNLVGIIDTYDKVSSCTL
jgi:hypothetical protein